MGVQGVSFSIKGEVITSHARDLVLSGKWREGLAYLREVLEGFTVDHAVSVLDGSMRLTGDSRTEILLEDDENSIGYMADLQDMYGSLARIDGTLCRPYRVITTYGDRDCHLGRVDGQPEFVPEAFHDDPHLNLDALPPRAMHYADHPADRACLCDVPSRRDPGRVRRMAVLFRPIGDVPMWVLPAASMQASVNARLHDVSYGGYERTYGSEDLRRERDPERMKAQAKMNFASMAPNRSIRDAEDMRRKLDENLAASREQSPEVFEARRREVLEQNAALGFGTYRFDFGGAVGVREVPLAPLAYWAIRRWSASAESLPDWKPVSPQGVKQIGDDPVHTDWVTGAGLEEVIHDLKDKQDELMARIQEEYLGLKVNVLVAGRRSARGRVVYAAADTPCEPDEIAIVPEAGPRYYEAARTAAATVALRGGAMSHLAQVGLEEGFLIVRVKDARSRYPEGSVIEIDADRGTVALVSFKEDDAPSGSMKP